jgi:hypothetical protein
MVERTDVYLVLVGKPEGKRTLGRPGIEWEDNIKMNLKDVGKKVWNGSIWLRIGTVGGHLRMRQRTFGFHKSPGNFLTGWKPVGLSRRALLYRLSE